MLAKNRANKKKMKHTVSMLVVASVSQEENMEQEPGYSVEASPQWPSTGFSAMGKVFQPLGRDYWGKRAGKKTANLRDLTYEVSGHQLAMKWGQGCGCLFSIICSAVEQGQLWRGIRIEFQCLHHHRQTAWESLQVGIPRPMKLKEFHIDKKALFSY